MPIATMPTQPMPTTATARHRNLPTFKVTVATANIVAQLQDRPEFSAMTPSQIVHQIMHRYLYETQPDNLTPSAKFPMPEFKNLIAMAKATQRNIIALCHNPLGEILSVRNNFDYVNSATDKFRYDVDPVRPISIYFVNPKTTRIREAPTRDALIVTMDEFINSRDTIPREWLLQVRSAHYKTRRIPIIRDGLLDKSEKISPF